MRVLYEVSLAELIAEEFGYDDHHGRWWETYQGRNDSTPCHPSPYPYPQDHDNFWKLLEMYEIDADDD